MTYYMVHRRDFESGRNPPNLCLVLVNAISPAEAMNRARKYAPPDCVYGDDAYTATPISEFCRGVRYVKGDVKTSGDNAPHVALDA